VPPAPPWYISVMGLLTFAINVTLDGCCDHREGIEDDELHDYQVAMHCRRKAG